MNQPSTTGAKVFGVLAIVAGIGIIVAALAGIELPWIVLALIPIVVVGYWSYYLTVVRPSTRQPPPPPNGTDIE